jgi:hypothetical protein
LEPRDPHCAWSGGKFVVPSAEERNKLMKTRSTQSNPGKSRKYREMVWRLLPLAALLVLGVAAVSVAFAGSAAGRQAATPQASQNTSTPNVKCVIGLENIKPNSRGTLTLLPTTLQFTAGNKKAEIPIASIQDIYSGQESRQDVSGPVGTMAKAGIPYGGGRFVSLFSHSVEVLTVEYVDSNGGFHGSVFVLAPGKASAYKDQLVAKGAKVNTHVAAPEQKEPKP